ncbi:RICIN domain-containing protein [Streptomyces sp. Tu102]|uniref:RICIN domain-containing protein n=1 Tax=Streptomyces sp. Tu102 TaxID=2838019 RepID=UPI001BDD692D|nr:RICIN domain-containing protein [Streptomyces sp. Tu102]MBT1091845.1 RICIN domain-containing protein [Streptomyces sp. Tu102]
MARRLLTLLAALLLALSLGQSSASAASFANPVKSVKGADPWIAYQDGNYHLVTTSWTDAITYTVVNRNSGKCLDVTGSSTADDTHRLVNVATGKILDTENCSSTDGADLRQWSLLNNTCQQWRLMPV